MEQYYFDYEDQVIDDSTPLAYIDEDDMREQSEYQRTLLLQQAFQFLLSVTLTAALWAFNGKLSQSYIQASAVMQIFITANIAATSFFVKSTLMRGDKKQGPIFAFIIIIMNLLFIAYQVSSIFSHAIYFLYNKDYIEARAFNFNLYWQYTTLIFFTASNAIIAIISSFAIHYAWQQVKGKTSSLKILLSFSLLLCLLASIATSGYWYHHIQLNFDIVSQFITLSLPNYAYYIKCISCFTFGLIILNALIMLVRKKILNILLFLLLMVAFFALAFSIAGHMRNLVHVYKSHEIKNEQVASFKDQGDYRKFGCHKYLQKGSFCGPVEEAFWDVNEDLQLDPTCNILAGNISIWEQFVFISPSVILLFLIGAVLVINHQLVLDEKNEIDFEYMHPIDVITPIAIISVIILLLLFCLFNKPSPKTLHQKEFLKGVKNALDSGFGQSGIVLKDSPNCFTLSQISLPSFAQKLTNDDGSIQCDNSCVYSIGILAKNGSATSSRQDAQFNKTPFFPDDTNPENGFTSITGNASEIQKLLSETTICQSNLFQPISVFITAFGFSDSLCPLKLSPQNVYKKTNIPLNAETSAFTKIGPGTVCSEQCKHVLVEEKKIEYISVQGQLVVQLANGIFQAYGLPEASVTITLERIINKKFTILSYGAYDINGQFVLNAPVQQLSFYNAIIRIADKSGSYRDNIIDVKIFENNGNKEMNIGQILLLSHSGKGCKQSDYELQRSCFQDREQNMFKVNVSFLPLQKISLQNSFINVIVRNTNSVKGDIVSQFDQISLKNQQQLQIDLPAGYYIVIIKSDSYKTLNLPLTIFQNTLVDAFLEPISFANNIVYTLVDTKKNQMEKYVVNLVTYNNGKKCLINNRNRKCPSARVILESTNQNGMLINAIEISKKLENKYLYFIESQNISFLNCPYKKRSNQRRLLLNNKQAILTWTSGHWPPTQPLFFTLDGLFNISENSFPVIKFGQKIVLPNILLHLQNLEKEPSIDVKKYIKSSAQLKLYKQIFNNIINEENQNKRDNQLSDIQKQTRKQLQQLHDTQNKEILKQNNIELLPSFYNQFDLFFGNKQQVVDFCQSKLQQSLPLEQLAQDMTKKNVIKEDQIYSSNKEVVNDNIVHESDIQEKIIEEEIQKLVDVEMSKKEEEKIVTTPNSEEIPIVEENDYVAEMQNTQLNKKEEGGEKENQKIVKSEWEYNDEDFDNEVDEKEQNDTPFLSYFLPSAITNWLYQKRKHQQQNAIQNNTIDTVGQEQQKDIINEQIEEVISATVHDQEIEKSEQDIQDEQSRAEVEEIEQINKGEKEISQKQIEQYCHRWDNEGKPFTYYDNDKKMKITVNCDPNLFIPVNKLIEQKTNSDTQSPTKEFILQSQIKEDSNTVQEIIKEDQNGQTIEDDQYEEIDEDDEYDYLEDDEYDYSEEEEKEEDNEQIVADEHNKEHVQDILQQQQNEEYPNDDDDDYNTYDDEYDDDEDYNFNYDDIKEDDKKSEEKELQKDTKQEKETIVEEEEEEDIQNQQEEEEEEGEEYDEYDEYDYDYEDYERRRRLQKDNSLFSSITNFFNFIFGSNKKSHIYKKETEQLNSEQQNESNLTQARRLRKKKVKKNKKLQQPSIVQQGDNIEEEEEENFDNFDSWEMFEVRRLNNKNKKFFNVICFDQKNRSSFRIATSEMSTRPFVDICDIQ